MKRAFAACVAAVMAASLMAAPAASARGWRCGEGDDRQPWRRTEPSHGDLREIDENGWLCAIHLSDKQDLIVRFPLRDGCRHLQRVKVRYRPRSVVVTLFSGSTHVPEGYGCTQAIVPSTVRIDLKEPLAGRGVIDGAAR